MRDTIDIIRNELLERQQKNRKYSMRAFAALLNLPVGTLSELLGRKRRLTKVMAEKISSRLFKDEALKQNFLEVFQSESRSFAPPEDSQQTVLEDDDLIFMGDWLYLAFLSLMETSDFSSDFRWISQRLGHSVAKIQQVSERLVRLGLIASDGENLFLRTTKTRTATDIPSEILRQYHRSVLSHVSKNLDDVPVHDRDVTSMTMAIDKKNLKVAKQFVASFRRTLCDLLESGEKSEVYHLNIQLFPVTSIAKKN